ncbi:MAG: permease-like cell division protein FtsX [candidate division WOR-3 bacterium]
MFVEIQSLLQLGFFGLILQDHHDGGRYSGTGEMEQLNPEQAVSQASAITGIVRARYVSKDQALDELRQDLGADSTLVNVLTENPLPPSVRVTVAPDYASAAQIEQIEQKLLLLPGVTEVWSGKEFVAQLNRIIRTLLLLDVIILAIVSAAVAFIVFQTVESSIIARSREVEIMELVGASEAAVRAPFVIEGTTQGVVGGAAAFVFLLALVRLISTVIPTPVFPVLAILAVNVLLGGLLGLIGSGIALNRIRAMQQQGIRVGTPDTGLR